MQRLLSAMAAILVGAGAVFAAGPSHSGQPVRLVLDYSSPQVISIKKEPHTPQLALAERGNFPIQIKKQAKKIKIEPKKEKPKKQKIKRKPSTFSQQKQTIFSFPVKKFNGDFISLYKRAGSAFGLPWQVLAAVHIVESGQSGDTAKRSYAGAVGPMQFLPSTFSAYAVDGNGDGRKSIYSVEDSVFTAANYISANLRKLGSIKLALFRYNRSWGYVWRVLTIAYSLGM